MKSLLESVFQVTMPNFPLEINMFMAILHDRLVAVR